MFRRLSIACAVLACSSVSAQEFPKPGPEHEKLKTLEGTWDGVGKSDGHEMKGVMTFKMDLGGLWLVSEFKSEFAPGVSFLGRGFDSYDTVKKKYVGVWFDNMSTRPMVSEGDLDAATGVMTHVGEGPAPDGTSAKYKMTSKRTGDDTMTWSMFMVVDGKDKHMITIDYKRRK